MVAVEEALGLVGVVLFEEARVGAAERRGAPPPAEQVADLVARHIVGADLPDYATDFLLARYDDPAYVASITSVDSGQL